MAFSSLSLAAGGPAADPPVAAPQASVSAFNWAWPADVNDDGSVTPQDMLDVIDELLLGRFGDITSQPLRNGKPIFVDTTNDGRLTPRDLLLVIDTLIATPANPGPPAPPPQALPPGEDPALLLNVEVRQLLERASAASTSEDAIIAIVDRGGRILGVRVEQGVINTIADNETMVFAIDGAVAKARTAAFFANDTAPLTSRTVRYISQSTVTQREVEGNPNVRDLNSPLRGPGFVAPIGLGGHFPPEVANTPLVDLFAIEHTNRDSIVHPGWDSIKGTSDDKVLKGRFDIPGVQIAAPESYGYESGVMPYAQSRGIATLPGGIPLYKNGKLVGGIGVFFPGPDGYATHEQGFVPGIGQSELARTNAPKVLEAEWIAFAAAGGSSGAGASVGALGGVPALNGFDLPFGRIDLVGIKLEIFAPRPSNAPASFPTGGQSGRDFVVYPGADGQLGSHPTDAAAADDLYHLNGKNVPSGWLVGPHGSGSITEQDVRTIIQNAEAEADRTRAAIRLPLGSRTEMVFAVAAPDGEILGLFRMPDATVFSIDVAVAKARNTVYYADPTTIQPLDRVDDDRDGIPDVPEGAAFSNRTFRFLAAPRFPTGAPEGTLSGSFSILRDPGINPWNGENLGAALPASVYTSVLGFDAFNPGRNFRDPGDIRKQNGIVFFPGSAPLYKNNTLIAGLGVSGDGVDQDDFVTFAGQQGFEVPGDILRADEIFIRGVRIPYQKFPRNPRG